MMDRCSVSTQVGSALRREAAPMWRCRSWEPGESELLTDRHTDPPTSFFFPFKISQLGQFPCYRGGRVLADSPPQLHQLRLHSPSHDRCNLSTAKAKRQRNAFSSPSLLLQAIYHLHYFYSSVECWLSPLPPGNVNKWGNLEPMLSRKASKHRGVIKNGMSSARPFTLSCSYFNSLPCPSIPRKDLRLYLSCGLGSKGCSKAPEASSGLLKREVVIMLMPSDLWFKLTEKPKLTQGESWCEVCRTSSFDGKVGRWRKKVEHTLIWVKVSVVQLKAGVGAMRDAVCLATVGKAWRNGVVVLYEPEFESLLFSTYKIYKLGIIISILYGGCFSFN